MSQRETYNTIVCPPTLLWEPNGEIGDTSIFTALLQEKTHPDTKKINKAYIANPFEFYLRTLLSACAYSVSIPAYGGNMWASPRQIKSLVSPSIGKRLRFVDRSHAAWNSINLYLEPVFLNLPTKSLDQKTDDAPQMMWHHANTIAWHLYLLLLAVDGHSEVPINPTDTIASIDCLTRDPLLVAESRARLAIIKGLFASFKKSENIPSFRCVLAVNHSLKERLDEIVDDAHLQDASKLRRFLSVQSNTRAIRKDLKKLVDFIARKRPWAKGAVMAASHAAMLPSSANELVDKIFGIFPELAASSSTPILVDPDSLIAGLGCKVVLTSQRLRSKGKENWCVVVRPTEGSRKSV